MADRPITEVAPLIERLRECDHKGDRLMLLPGMTPVECEVLRQLRCAVWDGNLSSKTARDSLVKRGFAIRFNGWQIASELGLITLETLGYLDGREVPCRRT